MLAATTAPNSSSTRSAHGAEAPPWIFVLKRGQESVNSALMLLDGRSDARRWSNIALTTAGWKCPHDEVFFPFFYFFEEGGVFLFQFSSVVRFPAIDRSNKRLFFNNMTKQVFSTTDVAAEAACLRARVIGYRVTNVYDAGASKVSMCFDSISLASSAVVVVVSPSPPQSPPPPLSHRNPSPSSAHQPRTQHTPSHRQGILLKLSRSGDDGDKAFLLLEPGSRFHLTSEPPERPDAPSGFALKLRKHLRSRRLEGLRQLGADRLVDLSFGSGKEEKKSRGGGGGLELLERRGGAEGSRRERLQLFSSLSLCFSLILSLFVTKNSRLKNFQKKKKQETARTTCCSSFTRRETSA